MPPVTSATLGAELDRVHELEQYLRTLRGGKSVKWPELCEILRHLPSDLEEAARKAGWWVSA